MYSVTVYVTCRTDTDDDRRRAVLIASIHGGIDRLSCPGYDDRCGAVQTGSTSRGNGSRWSRQLAWNVYNRYVL